MPQIGAKLCSPLRTRQYKLCPQSANRRRAECECPAVEARKLNHDRKPQTGPGLGFVQPATATCDLLALLWRQAGPVIVDQDPCDDAVIVGIRSLRETLDRDTGLRPLESV